MNNILEVMGSRSTKYGGVERFMVRLVKENPELTFHFVYNKDPFDKAYVDDLLSLGAKIHVINTLGMDVLTNIPRFYGLVKLLNPKAVHFHFSYVHALWAPVCRWLGVPKLYKTAHCSVFTEGKDAVSLSDMSLHHRVLMRWGKVFQIYDQNICVSKYVQKQFVKLYGDYSNSSVAYFGTDYPFAPQPDVQNVLKREIGAVHGTKILLSVMFADAIKGCDVLLNALPFVLGDYRLVIIGMDESSEYTRQMHELALELGVDKHVVWIGITNQVHSYMSVSDIYIQPSRTEALSLAAVEAMSHGLPIVASNVGGLPEVASCLFENEDSKDLAGSINSLFADPVKLGQMKQSQYRKWENTFYIGKGIEYYSGLYH